MPGKIAESGFVVSCHFKITYKDVANVSHEAEYRAMKGERCEFTRDGEFSANPCTGFISLGPGILGSVCSFLTFRRIAWVRVIFLFTHNDLVNSQAQGA